MTGPESVLLVDPSATLHTWANLRGGAVLGYWVKGNGWETRTTYSIERAWELAAHEIAAHSLSTK